MKTTLLLLALVALCLAQRPFSVPNAEMMGKAFDISTGTTYPKSINELGDIISKPQIYVPKFTDDLIILNTPAVETQMTVSETTSVSDVSSSMRNSVTVGASTPAVGFEASVAVSSFNRDFMSSYSYAMLSSGTVSVAYIRLKSADINPEFLRDAAQLPLDVNATGYNPYLQFIAKWGTHYLSEAVFGGRVTVSSSMTLRTRTSLVSQGVNINVGVSTMFRASVGVATSTELMNTAYTSVSSTGLTVNTFAFGGSPGEVSDWSAWFNTVAGNPLPISFKLQRYLDIIPDPIIRSNMETTLNMYVKGNLRGDRSLVMNATTPSANLYWTTNSGNYDNFLGCRKPVPPSSVWKRIGDVCNVANPLAVLAEVPPSIPEYAESSPLLAPPIDYVKIWSSSPSNGSPGSFWEPICSEGYFALGHIIHNLRDDKPAFSVTNCVHARCVKKCVPSRSFWSDQGSGTSTHVTLFLATENSPDVANYFNFFALPGYYNSISSVPADKFYCLATKCLAGPAKLTPATEQNTAALFTTPATVLPPGAAPTTGVPTTAVPTTAMPTTEMPTTSLPTTGAFITDPVVSSAPHSTLIGVTFFLIGSLLF